MSARRSTIDPFGLSFLDLISCAFAGILILYVTADSGEDEPQVDRSRLTVIEVQAARAVPATLGLRVRAGTKVMSSWQSRAEEGVHWLETPGKLSLFLQQDLGPATAEVVIRALPDAHRGQPLEVLVLHNTVSAGKPNLTAEHLYRASIPLP